MPGIHNTVQRSSRDNSLSEGAALVYCEPSGVLIPDTPEDDAHTPPVMNFLRVRRHVAPRNLEASSVLSEVGPLVTDPVV